MSAAGPDREPVERRERQLWLLALALVSLLAVVPRLGALDVGLLSDDYMQHAMIAGLFPGDGYLPFDLYAFMRADVPVAEHVEQGTIPWFTEPEFHAAVLRPLSSLLLWLDHTLVPASSGLDRVRLWHAHSLVWLVLAIFAFGLSARRLLPRWPAALAVVLFACDASFVSPLGWLANRCVLVCATFGFAAVFVHLEWRRPDPCTPAWLRRSGPLIELCLLGLSLAGGEYGLGAIAYLFVWELMFERSDDWRRRAHALIPAATAVTCYLALHRLFDYGTFGADVYVDPISNPIGWWKWTKFRIPALCTGALWSISPSSVMVFAHPGASWWQELWPADNPYEVYYAHMYLSLVGIAVAALGLWLARAGLHASERRTLRALLLAAFLGLLPVSVAPSHERLLVFAQLGACAAISLQVFACVRLLARPDARARVRGALLLPLVAVLLLFNTFIDLQWTQRYLEHLDGLSSADQLAFTEGNLLDQPLADRHVLVLNGASQTVGMYGPFVLDSMAQPVPASWRSLALGAEHPMFAFRPSANTLELTAIQGAWLMTSGELFFRRAEQMLPAGSKFDYPSMDVEILAADDGGHPTKVRFTFPHSLDDPRYLFVISTRQGLQRWSVPKVSRSAVVPLPRVPSPNSRKITAR